LDGEAWLNEQSVMLDQSRRIWGSLDALEARTFDDGEVVFRIGDIGDELFILKEGVAAIYDHGPEGQDILIARLKPGEAFGERALLRSGKRTATVIAEGRLSVAVVDRESFFDRYHNDETVRGYFNTLEKVYALSAIGIVTQYSGHFLGRPAVNVLIRQTSGSAVVATRLVDEFLFAVRAENFDRLKAHSIVFSRPDEGLERRLCVADGRLVGAYVSGVWDEVDALHQLVINRVPWSHEMDEAFISDGKLPAGLKEIAKNNLCKCMQLSTEALRETIKNGANSLLLVQEHSGAGAICGSCIPKIQEMLGADTDFEDVILTDVIEHPDDVRSFRFGNQQGTFRQAKLGNHVIVSGNLDGVWVERSYTLTSAVMDNAHREITVRRDKFGVFSNFLFSLQIGDRLRLSEPQGSLVFPEQAGRKLISFTAGIGITPMIGLVRSLEATRSDRSVHIIHCAKTVDALTGKKEIEASASIHDWLTYETVVTTSQGRITAEYIAARAVEVDADYFICGPSGFQTMVSGVLQRSGIPDNRIAIESFGANAKIENNDKNESSVAPWLAFGLTLLFVASGIWGWLQDINFFLHQSWAGSVITGLLLILLLIFQSRIAHLRLGGRRAEAARHKRTHQWIGLITPVFLALHTASFGYGVSLALSVCLLLIMTSAVGLQPAFSGTWLRNLLLKVHLCLSLSLLGLLIAHTWVVLRF
jgi:ferredoxin-NADP reductase/bacterioferritin-associated ferredoxin